MRGTLVIILAPNRSACPFVFPIRRRPTHPAPRSAAPPGRPRSPTAVPRRRRAAELRPSLRSPCFSLNAGAEHPAQPRTPLCCASQPAAIRDGCAVVHVQPHYAQRESCRGETLAANLSSASATACYTAQSRGS